MSRPISSRLLLVAALVGALAAASSFAQAPKPRASAGGDSQPTAGAASEEVVLAEGTGLKLTAANVEAELARQPGRASVAARSPETLRELVEQMVRMELLAQEAERRGYGEHPAVVQAVKEEAVQELHRTLVDGQVTPATVSLEDIAAYYEEHEAQFKRPAMRRARHILFEKKSEAQALLAKAREAGDRDFQQLAREHSIDTETKQRGGDLRFFTLEDDSVRREAPVHPALRKAAFALEQVGDTVAKPVEVDGRWSIVRLTGIRKARETTLAQAEPSIRTRLWRRQRKQALTSLMDRLRSELKPQVFADRIEKIDLTDAPGRPGGFAPDPARARTERAGEAELEQPKP